MKISAHAIIAPSAKLGANVTVEPFAIIESDVQIGDQCTIASHSIIKSGTIMGKHCEVHAGAIVGGDPQDLKYSGESTQLIIGDHVVIREYCTLNRGTAASGSTVIGDHVLLMAYVHIAHDCHIADHVILANAVNLAGHVEIGPYAIVGGMSAVQQFMHIGESAYIGGGALVRKDVPPFIRAGREPLQYAGVNAVGLRRRAWGNDDINTIHEIYSYVFVKNTNRSLAIKAIENDFDANPRRDQILNFLRSSKHGIIKGV